MGDTVSVGVLIVLIIIDKPVGCEFRQACSYFLQEYPNFIKRASCRTLEKLIFCSKAALLSHAGIESVFLTDFSKCCLAYAATSTVTILTNPSQGSSSNSFAISEMFILDGLDGAGIELPLCLLEYKYPARQSTAIVNASSMVSPHVDK